MCFGSIFAFLLLLTQAYAVLDQNAKILVLLDHAVTLDTHSLFFEALRARGYDMTYRMADDPSLEIKSYGVYLYKQLIIFAPSVEFFGGDLNVVGLTEFVDAGGNVLVAGGERLGGVLRDFAVECGVEFDAEYTKVIDHLNYDITDSGNHTKILTKTRNLHKAQIIFEASLRSDASAPLVYHGTALLVQKRQLQRNVMMLLTAEHTAYSYTGLQRSSRMRKAHLATGRNTVLIAGMQARNNARVVLAGSLYFFSNDAYNMSVVHSATRVEYRQTSNSAVAEALSAWLFGEQGHLRITAVTHHRPNELNSPVEPYTINEMVVYEIAIEQLFIDKWQPYLADNSLHLEFVRIDPYIRCTLKRTKGAWYWARFKIPDVYGIYQFRVKHMPLGYTYVENTTQVVVRPLRHDEYERFIYSAVPYYTSAISMMFGVFVFSFVFLYHRDSQQEKPQGKSLLKLSKVKKQ